MAKGARSRGEEGVVSHGAVTVATAPGPRSTWVCAGLGPRHGPGDPQSPLPMGPGTSKAPSPWAHGPPEPPPYEPGDPPWVQAPPKPPPRGLGNPPWAWGPSKPPPRGPAPPMGLPPPRSPPTHRCFPTTNPLNPHHLISAPPFQPCTRPDPYAPSSAPDQLHRLKFPPNILKFIKPFSQG